MNGTFSRSVFNDRLLRDNSLLALNFHQLNTLHVFAPLDSNVSIARPAAYDQKHPPRTPFLLHRRKPPVGLLVCSEEERIFGRAG